MEENMCIQFKYTPYIILTISYMLQTLSQLTYSQWAAGGFEEFLNIMNFYVFLIVWDNRVNKL